MNGRAMNGRDEHDVRDLMMAALDGELAPAERAELVRRLAADPELSKEWERLQRLKELTTMSKIKSPPEAQWDHYRRSVYNRIERGVGWILVSVGAAVLIGYGLWEAIQSLLADTSMPEYLKLAIFALGAGAVVLLISIVREKLFTYRHDPYKEVER